ncbi:MAG: peptide chain release factor N(5)-glutamine methyltransferase [Deltaproteobacteria bacterium]|nr:peptide chain release factor N(5)-glutamine methyltransferase [Deltaproteobacteria bacterium]
MTIERPATTADAIAQASGTLRAAGIQDGRAEAEFFLTHLLGCKRHELYLGAGRVLNAEERGAFADFIARRLRREPAQYIAGVTEFHGLEFKAAPEALIPRPETELLVNEALSSGLQRDAVIIDLCTGSGCVAVTIAVKLPYVTALATDISSGTLKVAEENAKRHGIAHRVRFIEGDLFAPLAGLALEGQASLILSNPPYVAEAEFEGLQPEVRDYEPRSALVAGPDGLEFYRRIIKDAPAFLTPGGWLMVEIGYGQAGRAADLFNADGRYNKVEVKKDLSGIERVVKARLRQPGR